MQISSDEVQEHRCDIDDFRYNGYDYNRKVPFEIDRPSPFSISTSPGYIPPLSPVKRSSWDRLSFGKFSSQPIRISILKLDGSSFDVIVTKKATVAKLKKAVEAAFSHLPLQGDGKISWSHVWGHFCLCFENMKLLRDRDSIKRYGIQNGAQLQFVQHTPIYEIAGERLEKLAYGLDEPEGSSSNSDLYGDMKMQGWNDSSNQQNLVRIEVNEGYGNFGANTKSRSSWACTMRGLFSHRRLEGSGKENDSLVHSKARLGRPFPHDDANINGRRDITCRLGNGSNRYECGTEYSLNSFIGFTGGFGGFTYPTGYCLK